MSDNKDTIVELAEIIAEQNRVIRELELKLESQDDIIVEYELEKENAERFTAELEADLEAALDDAGDTQLAIAEILDHYFGEELEEA